MQLVRQGDADAFEVVFDRHSGAAFSLAYRMCGRTGDGRGHRPGGVRVAVAQRRALRRHARERAHVGADGRTNRAIDVLRREGARGGRDVGQEGAAERVPSPELTDAEVERRDEARQVRKALGSSRPSSAR